MRTLPLATAVTLLLAGCGFDSAMTPADESGPDIPEPELATPVTEITTAAAVTNAWTTKAPMPTARHALAAGVVNGLLYAVGGNAGSTKLPTVEAYNPSTNSGSTRAGLPSGRTLINGAGTINGVLYVAGGMDQNDQNTKTLFAYNPSTNTWATKAPMLTPGSGGATGVIGGKL